MATLTSVTCGDSTYYTITCCDGTKFYTGNIQGYADKGISAQQNFNFLSNYTINIAGITIPIVKTTRTWSNTLDSVLTQPSNLRGVWSEGSIYGTFCTRGLPSVYSTSVSEDCVVEKSTLHYLDLRYGVCLYRYVRESLQFSKSVSDNISTSDYLSKSSSLFQGAYGSEVFWKIAIKDSEAIVQGLEEWRLIINGVQTVLSSTEYTKSVMNERIISSPECGGENAVGEILLFPAPGTFSNPVDCDVKNWAWYKNGVQPGMVNYYYPDWCKALQLDPFWEAAEQSRLSVVFDHTEPVINNSYTPPPINVDPIPIGSYAKHPIVGEVYQWLTQDVNGGIKVTTSPELISIIDAKLPEGMKTHDTTLIYPISLV